MKKLSKKRCVLVVIAIALIGLIAWTVWGNTALEVNAYAIVSDRLPNSFSGFRIAQVSDLHNAQMGDGNEKLIAMLRETGPDIIVITGDMVDSYHTDIDIALRFAEDAMKIAPCYYVTGNHEARISEYSILKAGLEFVGVVILENERIELERNSETVTLIGIEDPSFQIKS